MPWIDRKPAPGRLEVVRSFVNTRDLARGGEVFQTPRATADWMLEQGLTTVRPSIGERGLAEVIDVREAFRSLLARHGPPDAAAVEAVNDVAGRAGVSPRLQADGTVRLRAARRGLDGALGTLVAIAFEAQADGSWHRLKACAACRWAFYDTSRNRSSRWCDMAVCGNRAKQHAHYLRRHSE